MVNEIGKCVSVTGNYDPGDDYTKGQAANNHTSSSSSTKNAGPLHFRADSVDYCEIADAACTECRNSVFPQVNYRPDALAKTTFCYGSGGCVCIAICESTVWSEAVGGKQCPTPTPTPPPYFPKKYDDGMKVWEITLIVIAALLAILIGVILFKRRREDQLPRWMRSIMKKFRPKSPEQSRSDTSTPPESPSNSSTVGGPKREGLSLFGWRSMREELIDNENNRLAMLEERSPQSGFVQFADTTPSAPEFDDGHAEMSSAPAHPSAPAIDL